MLLVLLAVGCGEEHHMVAGHGRIQNLAPEFVAASVNVEEIAAPAAQDRGAGVDLHMSAARVKRRPSTWHSPSWLGRTTDFVGVSIPLRLSHITAAHAASHQFRCRSQFV